MRWYQEEGEVVHMMRWYQGGEDDEVVPVVATCTKFTDSSKQRCARWGLEQGHQSNMLSAYVSVKGLL